MRLCFTRPPERLTGWNLVSARRDAAAPSWLQRQPRQQVPANCKHKGGWTAARIPGPHGPESGTAWYCRACGLRME